MAKNSEPKRSKYAVSTNIMINEFLSPEGKQKITTKIFSPDRIGIFEDYFKKDACEWTSAEIRIFVQKFAKFYTKSTVRNHLNIFRNYRDFMIEQQKKGNISKDIKIATDEITESEILDGIYFKTFSVINHFAVDTVMGAMKRKKPMETLLWMMTFYFAPTLNELKNMKAEQIELKYYHEDFSSLITNTMDKLTYKDFVELGFKEALWTTCEGRVIDLCKPDRDNITLKLGHANSVVNTLGQIAMLTGDVEREQQYVPCTHYNNLILRNQIRVSGSGQRVVGEVFAESRVPSMLASFAKFIELSDTVSYSDLVYSHILYRICSLHEKQGDLAKDPNLEMLKNVGLVKKGKIDKDVIDEIWKEYGYDEDFVADEEEETEA